MIGELEGMLPALFAIAAVLYVWLALRVSRAAAGAAPSAIGLFLFLVGTMLAGSAFSYRATDAGYYGVGRVLTFFSAGFLPVALYRIYREFTVGRPRTWVLALLSVIPIISTALAMSNDLHGLIWTATEVNGRLQFGEPTRYTWFRQIHLPFAYGLFGYSLVALAGRLPTIALAHRRKILLILVTASVPFSVSFANTVLGIGPIDFPFTALSLAALLPISWWISVGLRVHELSPLAYQTMFDHVRDPIIVLDKSQRIISANSPAQKLLRAAEHSLVGHKLADKIPEAPSILALGKDRDLTQTVRMQRDRYFELNSAELTGPTGQAQGTVVVCRDVTERKKALRALADSEHLIRSLVEHSSNGILRFSREAEADGGRLRCIFANRAAERFLQCGDGTLVGMPLEKIELLDPEKLTGSFAPGAASASGNSYETAIEGDGEDLWLRVVAEPVGDDISVTLIDITARKRTEDRIMADALRDPLTGVLNRRGFERMAGEAMAASDVGAVIYLDLNHFKTINDRFGHQAGDALLKAFGHRLEFCLRPDDVLARLGGDEFAIVLPGISIEDAKHVARRLVDSAFEAYIIQGQEIECTASVGIALMPEHGRDLWELVSVADKAMYEGKQISKDDAANDRAAYVDSAVAS